MRPAFLLFGWVLLVQVRPGQLMVEKPAPLKIVCPPHVYVRWDTETQSTCLWSLAVELSYSPAATPSPGKAANPPRCQWFKNGVWFIDTSQWSGTVSVSAAVGDEVTVRCVSADCWAPVCTYPNLKITMAEQDIRFFIIFPSPPAAIYQYAQVQLGWCAKMKSTSWTYVLVSRAGTPGMLIPSNYYTEIALNAYPPGVGSICSAYYNYVVNVTYTERGKHVASLTLQDGGPWVLTVEVKQPLLHVLSATSNLIPITTNLKLAWNLLTLTEKVVGFQLTDINKAGSWALEVNKNARKAGLCCSLSKVGYGFAVLHFLISGSKMPEVSGELAFSKGVAALTATTKLGEVLLHFKESQSSTYYFSPANGLYYTSKEKETDVGSSIHHIFYEQESLTYLFQIELVGLQMYRITAHVYLNTKSFLYKALTGEIDAEAHFFNSGVSLLYTPLYVVWFIPLQPPSLQCDWIFTLEVYGPRKSYLSQNTSYSYKDNVPGAAKFIPRSALSFNVKLYVGFVAKLNCTESGTAQTVLKVKVGTYASKILESPLYCYKVYCEISEFAINKPPLPTSIITSSKGSPLSVFVFIRINCSVSETISIIWRIYNISSVSDIPVWDSNLKLPHISPTNLSTIEIPRFALDYGLYLFNVSIDMATPEDEALLSSSDAVVVHIQESGLKVEISGGDFRTVGFSTFWVLDGSSSSDPDSPDPLNGLTFIWYCTKNKSDYSLMNYNTSTICHPGQTNLIWINPNLMVQTLAPKSLLGNINYYFRLVVSKGKKMSHFDQNILVVPDLHLNVSFRCIENCGRILIPTERFSFAGKCLNCDFTSKVVYEWSLFQDSTEVNLDWKSKTMTGRSNNYMSFIPLAFIDIGNKWYSLVVNVTAWNSAPAINKYLFYVNSPPKTGTCKVTPFSGVTLKTKFALSCSGFSGTNQPLSYKVIAALDTQSSISSLEDNLFGVVIYDGFNPTIPSFFLPIGKPLKVYVKVYDAGSTYTKVTFTVTVKDLDGDLLKNTLNKLISMSNSSFSPLHVFLETGDFIKSGHLIYMMASVMNTFNRTHSKKPFKDNLRESLLNITFSTLITNVMGINQIIVCISELTEDITEVNLKSQQLALGKLMEVVSALRKYRKEMIGSVETESLSTGILNSLANIMRASLLHVTRFTTDVSLDTVNVLKQLLSIMETVTDIVSFGKVPGENETLMEAKNFKISLKKDNVWNFARSYAKKRKCQNCFYPMLPNDSSLVPVDSVVTSAFYEFQEDPLAWLKNRRDIDTVVSGFYIVAIDSKGGVVNIIPEIVDVIMERRNVIPVYKILVGPDTFENITSGTFCFEVNLETKSEWFIQFFYTEELAFNISLYVGSISANNTPVAFFHIPHVEFIPLKTLLDIDSRTWDPKIIRVPIESLPDSSPVINLTILIKTSSVVPSTMNDLLSISIFNVACLNFQGVGDLWNEENCRVGPLTNNKQLHCICKDFSKRSRRIYPFLNKRHTFLAARVFVVPNPVDLTKLSVYVLKENVVTLFTIIVIFIIYVALAIWAFKKDKEEIVIKQQVITLPDNDPYETTCFLVTIYTGSRFGSGTTADVYLKIVGRESNSQVHLLKSPGHKVFLRGGLDTFLLTTKYALGEIYYIRIWHNNKGKSPHWYLSRVKIENLYTEEVSYFMCRKWLAIDKEDCLIHRIFFPMNPTDKLSKLDFLQINFSHKFIESHLWLSVFAAVLPDSLSRVQRLSCCLTSLMCSLLANIIFFNAGKDEDDTLVVDILKTIIIGIESAVIIVPVQLIVFYLFKYSTEKTTSKQHPSTAGKQPFYSSLNGKQGGWRERLENMYFNEDMSDDIMVKIDSSDLGLSSPPSLLLSFPKTHKVQHNCVMPEVVADEIEVDHIQIKGKISHFERKATASEKRIVMWNMPHIVYSWSCLYVAWTLVFLISNVSAFLIVFYGLSYGREVSMQWLLASLVSFIQTVFVIQILVFVLRSAFSSLLPKSYSSIPWTSKGNCFEFKLYGTAKSQDEMRELHCKLVILRNSKEYKPLKDDEIKLIKKNNLLKRKANNFFKGIISHFIFFLLVLYLISSTDNTNMFYYNQAVYNQFSVNITHINTIDDIYNWANSIFLPLIHNLEQPTFLRNSWSKILGLPRMRQVKATHCLNITNNVFEMISNTKLCVKKYGIVQDNENATTSDQIDPKKHIDFTFENNIPHWSYSSGAAYGNGGYSVYFVPDETLEQSQKKLENLKNAHWLNQETWAVIVELATYNPDINLFCAISVTFEATMLGIVNTDISVSSFSLVTIQDISGVDIFLYFLFIAFMLIYVANEILTIRQQRKYYINILNVINLFLKCLLILAILFQVVKFVLAAELLRLYSLYPQQFILFYTASYIDFAFRAILGFLMFFVLLKTLKYAKFVYDLRLTQRSIMEAIPGTFSMAFVVFVYYFSYAAFGYLVFGQHERCFNTFIDSIQTVLSYSVSSFQATRLENDHFLGALYLASFMFFMICIVLNLFQAVIISAYDQMKQPVYEELSDEAEIVALVLLKLRMAWALITKKPPINSHQ